MERRRPSELRFTHDSISNVFHDGRSLEETLNAIVSGRLKADFLPTIEVMERDGKLYVVSGNRRLYVFKQLEARGSLQTVEIRKVPFCSSVFQRQFTSVNDGQSVRVRYGRRVSDSDDEDDFCWGLDSDDDDLY